MIKIDIKEEGNYFNLDALKKVWHENWKLQYVEVNWNSIEHPDCRKPETWPFKALFSEGGDEITVRIFSVSVGNDGTGPRDLASILGWLGVRYNADDIFTPRAKGEDGWIHLTYKN